MSFCRMLSVLSLLALGCSSGEKAGGPASSSAQLSASAAAASASLKPGDAAPAVTLTLHNGQKVDLASLKDKLTLVYFYPKDETKGCTIEAEGVRDAWAKFQEAGIDVYGVSTQDAVSHQAFIDKHELPFPLVVDTDGKVAEAFKVPLRSGLASRQSFLVGKDGRIKAVWPDVNPGEHADQVLKAAKS